MTIHRTIINPANWSFADAARIVKTALEMMRLAAGLSTTHRSSDEVMIGEAPDQGMSQEERDARVLELLERARARRDAALMKAQMQDDEQEGGAPGRVM